MHPRTRKAACEQAALDHPPTSAHHTNYLATIDPKVPARLLLGPAVKNSSFSPPLLDVPPPNSIPHSWSMWIGLPLVSLIVPTNCPVRALKALIVPFLLMLFETSSVLLSGPKFFGAAASPQGWFRGAPWTSCFRKTPFSL